MPTAPCAECGTAFQQNAARRACCSLACRNALQRRQSVSTLVERFWNKVNKTDDCWLWTASTILGYGQFHAGRADDGSRRTVYAHRFSWEHFNGPIPDGLSVLHRCDTPPCVNPDHLFIGTQPDNLTDARVKGRLIDGRHLIKVDDAGMADIRANYRPRTNDKQLAAKYGITTTSVVRIAQGKQRVAKPLDAVFERVPSVQLQIRGEVS